MGARDSGAQLERCVSSALGNAAEEWKKGHAEKVKSAAVALYRDNLYVAVDKWAELANTERLMASR